MANPIPCGICEQVPDAEFLVTDMTPDFQLLGKPTIGMCVQCFIEKGMALATALQAAFEAYQAEEEGPGVLAAVEADEGPQEVNDPVPPAPKSKARKEPAPAAETGEREAASAHVDG